VRADEFDASVMCGPLTSVQEQIDRILALGNEATAKDGNVMIILELVREMLCRGIHFDPIDLYSSDATRFLMTETGILPPLDAIPGLGANAAQTIVQAREEGKFLSVEDLKKRGKVSSAIVENMKQFRVLDGMTQTNQISLFDIL
jgi:DNA polymerase-3 subunit alpha (Gram-positive type)